MAVSSSNSTHRFSWSDEIGLLPLLLTLILPLVIGVIVLLKCVYNHCCLRKTTAKSYTVKPTLKSWKGTQEDDETDSRHPHSNSVEECENHPSSTRGSATIPNVNALSASISERVIPIETEESHPVPPRRSGSSQWRRNLSQAQAQQNSTNENQVNFSGDSQDSRGYTRISVREPLSNIRNQAIRRNVDSHYATVSDDSEEMYAAIEDGDGNYMYIPGDDARNWQERREANSPLPPVPPPISPVLLPSSDVLSTNTGIGLATADTLPPIQPPIYAQVTKTKKSKAPIPPTPSLATPSTSSSHAPFLTIPPDPPSETPPPAPNTSSIMKRSHHHTSAILDLDPPDIPSEPRRWSKADISYSEFEVVREPPFSSISKSQPQPPLTELIDEDNYNLIPDVRTSSRLSSHQSDNTETSASNAAKSRTLPHKITDSQHTYSALKKPLTSSLSHSEDSHNNAQRNHGYAELTKRNTSIETRDRDVHSYSEITKQMSSHSPSDYYQEIGNTKSIKKRDNLYQKIRRKGGDANGEESDDEDEDDEDQFYEKVKVKPAPTPPPQGSLPENSNPSALKHGYEKIKPKPTTGCAPESALPPQPKPPQTPPNLVGESDEDGSLYEVVKYPPYERLKESQDNLQEDDEEEEEDVGRDNLYEDIGYSRIKKSTKASQNQVVSPGAPVSVASPPSPSPVVDVDNLYARVDMTKKKRNSVKSQKKDHSIEYI